MVQQRVAAQPPRLSARKRLAFRAAAVALAMLVGVAAFLGLDVYLHHRTQYVGGVNVWGYRGDTAKAKQPLEARIVALGGSTVFGFGLPWNQAWPYYLEHKLRAIEGRRPVTVVNLGVPTDSAQTFASTLDDYDYLDYDIALFYEGYNDLNSREGPDAAQAPSPSEIKLPVSLYLSWRHRSPVFRLTGYYPIFPLVVHEKAMSMLGRLGSTDDAVSPKKIAFRPNLATRATAETMKAAAQLAADIDHAFGALTTAGLSTTVEEDCGRWRRYCGAVSEAVEDVVARGKIVVVITQPLLSDLHREQQTALATMLRRRFGDNPRVRHVDLGHLIDMRDTTLVYDGLHLVARGNELVAEALVPPVAQLIK